MIRQLNSSLALTAIGVVESLPVKVIVLKFSREPVLYWAVATPGDLTTLVMVAGKSQMSWSMVVTSSNRYWDWLIWLIEEVRAKEAVEVLAAQEAVPASEPVMLGARSDPVICEGPVSTMRPFLILNSLGMSSFVHCPKSSGTLIWL